MSARGQHCGEDFSRCPLPACQVLSSRLPLPWQGHRPGRPGRGRVCVCSAARLQGALRLCVPASHPGFALPVTGFCPCLLSFDVGLFRVACPQLPSVQPPQPLLHRPSAHAGGHWLPLVATSAAPWVVACPARPSLHLPHRGIPRALVATPGPFRVRAGIKCLPCFGLCSGHS